MVETIDQCIRRPDPQEDQREHGCIEQDLGIAEHTPTRAGRGIWTVEAAEFGEQEDRVEDQEEEGEEYTYGAPFLDVVVVIIIIAIGGSVG